MPDVILRIGGRPHGGWKSVSVTSSMEQLAGTFEITLSDRWPGRIEEMAIKRGAPCQLYYGDHLLITGFIDDANPGFTKEEHDIQVAGRDVTCDLVDCSYVGEQPEWKAEKLLAIAREICGPFKAIEVAAEVDLGGELPKEKYNPGDTIHAFLLRLARKQSVIMVSYGDGRLVFTRAGTQRMGVALVQGENIKTARLTGTNKDRFSEYHVKGKASTTTLIFDKPPKPGADMFQDAMDLFNESTASTGQAQDPGVARYRPLVILAETGATKEQMEKRALYEAASRAGRSLRATIEVQGWEAKPGVLWRINRLVRVDSSYLDMKGDYLIESVIRRLDESGTITELGIIHPDAYLPEPLKPGKGPAGSVFDWNKRS